MAVADVYSFLELDDGTGLAGMPTRAQCEEIRDAGFRTVINLAPEDCENALPNEPAVWRDLGLEYVSIPVPWEAPSMAHVDAFVTAMEEAEGSPTFVHCQANMRVTAFYAIYAVRKLGWSRDKADALIEGMWSTIPNYEMDDNWRGLIEAGMGKSAP